MKNKNILLIIISLSILIFSFSHTTYARYVLKRDFNITVSSKPFYFNATNPNNIITFNRTADTKDYDIILMDNTNFNITVQNNNGTNYNDFDVTYEISIIDSPKFSFSDDTNTITKTIKGGSKLDEVIDLNLKIKDMANPSKNVKIRVTAIKPYESEPIDLTYSVIQLGAIQTIEDLLDLSLEVRGLDKNGQRAVVTANNERFKLTRNLDFSNRDSYDNSYRTDYGDINLNGINANTIFEELTSDTGFLPIGETDYKFSGIFNGGNNSISNLKIHKSKQKDIGLFGFVEKGTIKNLILKNGNVINENQTAGMLVGKLVNGTIDNVRVEGGEVQSNDTIHITEDTYAGGVVGYTAQGSTIKNCYNSASVTTKFTGDSQSYSGPAGGITAWMSTSTIDHCINEGTVVGQSYVGGIAGFSGMQDPLSPTDGYGTISYCENSGIVKTYVTTQAGGLHIGGIAGYNKLHGIIEYNTNKAGGIISGKNNIGGIVGNSPGIVRHCKNYSSSITATATSSKKQGPIIGSGSNAGNTDNHNYA